MASQMDEEGLPLLLGSYDCRAYDDNSIKKDVVSRQRRVNTGRNRLIWSAMHTSNGRPTFHSFLHGGKIDAKRPREIRVGVRLNGRLLTEVTGDEDGHGPMNESSVLAVKLVESTPSTNTDIKAFCEESLPNEDTSQSTLNATCTFDTEEYHRKLMERTKGTQVTSQRNKSKNQIELNINECYVPMKHGGTILLKHISPIILCVPLDDEIFRVYCETPGKMQGSSVHDILDLAVRKHSTSNVCSVCWAGAGKPIVLECVDCGLLVHHECCFGQGEFMPNDTKDNAPGVYTGYTDLTKSTEGRVWRCPVCVHSVCAVSAKSQRIPRVPSRFVENTESPHIFCQHAKRSSKIRPDPKCYLCPHSGGAMSPYIVKHSHNEAHLERWAHEICRIWCARHRNELDLKPQPVREGERNAPDKLPYMHSLSSVCAICGIGDFHTEDSQKEVSSYTSSSITGVSTVKPQFGGNMFVPGLTRCAARGCSVTFHALCAVLTTKLRMEHPGTFQANFGSNVENNNNDMSEKAELKIKSEDFELCQQYTLEIVQLTRTEGLCGNLSGVEKESFVPIALCGIHNPRRHKSFYGCPPAAENFSLFMKIPHVQAQLPLPKNMER